MHSMFLLIKRRKKKRKELVPGWLVVEYMCCCFSLVLFFLFILQKEKRQERYTMLQTFYNTYHVQFGLMTQKVTGLWFDPTSYNPGNALNLIFLKDSTFTQGLKISCLMTKLRVMTAFKFLSKRQGCAKNSICTIIWWKKKKSAFDTWRMHWPYILSVIGYIRLKG